MTGVGHCRFISLAPILVDPTAFSPGSFAYVVGLASPSQPSSSRRKVSEWLKVWWVGAVGPWQCKVWFLVEGAEPSV